MERAGATPIGGRGQTESTYGIYRHGRGELEADRRKLRKNSSRAGRAAWGRTCMGRERYRLLRGGRAGKMTCEPLCREVCAVSKAAERTEAVR